MTGFLIEDLPKLCYVNNVKWNASGTKAAYVLKTHDVGKNSYRNTIWLYDDKTKKSTQFTHMGEEADFIWDTEDSLLFISDREPGEKKKWPHAETHFYRLPVTGGEAGKAFSLELEAERIEKIADGKYVVMALTDLRQAEYLAMSEEEQKEELDYHVFEEVPFWGNGRGYIAGKRYALYIYEEENKTLKQITSKEMDVSDFDINEQRILYVGKTWSQVIPETDGAYEYDCVTETTKTIVEQGTYIISHAVYLDDEILITATDMIPYGSGQNHWFYLYSQETGTLKLIAENTDYIGCGSTSDSLGGGQKLVVAKACASKESEAKLLEAKRASQADATSAFNTESAQKSKAYFIAQTGPDCKIYSIGAAGNRECLVDFDGAIACLSVSGKKILFSANARDNVSELYLTNIEDRDAAAGQPVAGATVALITAHNQKLLTEKSVSHVIHEPFTNRDGIRVDGWIIKPVDYDETKKYPAILEIHGGPRAAYGTSFIHEMQVFAGAGYFVFFCNPRGSEGYGEEFADLRGKYGSIDYNDLMDFTDHILKKYPQIDEKRVGASGGSYGGFMCNWIEGHTDRFAAICSQRSIADWVADFGNSEIGVHFDQNEFGVNPWTGADRMWDQSPLKYACNAKTPILFIHSLRDYNCTLDQGAAMFTAMKFFGVPSRMCIFEGENHSLSRSGKPKHRMRRLREMLTWFDKYLKPQVR